jgi:hypothetical protein
MNEYLLNSDSHVKSPLKRSHRFVCAYCLKSYNDVKVYYPVKDLSPYFHCARCESVYPFGQVKEVHKCKLFFGFCCFF